MRLFPPPDRAILHEAVLDEILEEKVSSGRGRCVPRGVKRKMSNYALRARDPMPTKRIDYRGAIRVLN
jgi:hypothetical protein